MANPKIKILAIGRDKHAGGTYSCAVCPQSRPGAPNKFSSGKFPAELPKNHQSQNPTQVFFHNHSVPALVHGICVKHYGLA